MRGRQSALSESVQRVQCVQCVQFVQCAVRALCAVRSRRQAQRGGTQGPVTHLALRLLHAVRERAFHRQDGLPAHDIALEEDVNVPALATPISGGRVP